MKSAHWKPRDSAKPASYYSNLARQLESAAKAGLKLKSTAVLRSVADKYRFAAYALYSGGAPVAECEAKLAEAARCFDQYLASSTENRPLLGIPDIASYVENISAGCLTGTGPAGARTLRRARIENVRAWQEAVLSLLAAVFGGGEDSTGTFDMTGAPAEYGPHFVDLLGVVAARNRGAFADKLEKYLTEEWAPRAERAARGDLNSVPPRYVGKFALISAALCQIMGGVPELSPKALIYVPSDLVSAGRVFSKPLDSSPPAQSRSARSSTKSPVAGTAKRSGATTAKKQAKTLRPRTPRRSSEMH